MEKIKAQKWVSGLLTATMIVSGVSWTPSTASAAVKSFSDIVPGHWAQKHLSKLTMQEILSGYSDGTFQPNRSVSHQEAVVLAIRFMGVEDELENSDVIITPESLKIDNTYKRYINLAVKKKILDIDEETELAKENPNTKWGSSPASREWVTRLIVRATGKDSDAKLAAQVATSFPDDNRIGDNYRGYVNVAVSTGLVKGVITVQKGVEVTQFSPADAVNRASIATLFSLAQAEVAFSGQVSGVLLALTPTQLTLLHEGGIVQDYTINADSYIYRMDSNFAATLEQLKLFGKVNLIIKSDKSVGYVEQTSDAPEVDVYSGTLTNHATSLNRLTVLIGEMDRDFTYDSKYSPIVTDSNGNKIKISDLPEHVEVKLTVDKIRTGNNIISIEVQQSVVNKSGSGVVTGWDPSTSALLISDFTAETPEQLTLSPNAIIRNSAGANLLPEQLKVNDEITYVVKTGLVTSVVVTKTETPAISGVLYAVDKAKNSIQYTVDKKLAADFLATNVKVKITGIPTATFDDIYAGDEITLTQNASGNVTLITVTNRSVESMTAATIIDYARNAKTLILTDANGKKHNFDISTTTKFELNGTYLTLEAATPYLSTAGKKINLTYTGQNLISVSLVAKFTGTITENNSLTRTLKVMTDTNNLMTFSYTNTYVDVFGKTAMTPADLLVGAQVTFVISDSQNQLSSLQLHKNVQLEVVSVTSSSNRIGVKDTSGNTTELNLGSNVVLLNESGAPLSLNSLAAGSFVNVSFQGTTPVKVKAVPAGVYGRVSSVNTSAPSIEIITATQTVIARSLGTNPIIMRDNVVLGSLAAVMPEDRVEIRYDEKDQIIVEIFKPVSKMVNSVNVATKTIELRKATLSDTNNFLTVEASVYIHQGASSLLLSNLKNGDSINLYYIRGKLVEINKL